MLCVIIYEIAKGLPDEMIKENNGAIFKDAVPIIYINRFKQNEPKLKALCRKAYQYLSEMVPHIVESNQEEIFKVIGLWFDSSSYDDRLAASMAVEELCTSKLTEEDVKHS